MGWHTRCSWVVVSALSLGALGQTKPDPAALALEAEHKQAAGDLDGALVSLSKAAGLTGAPAELRLRLGRLYDLRGEVDLAIDAYTAAAAQQTGAPKAESLARRALAQELRAMLAEASASAEEASKADPASAWALIVAARRQARAGENDAALERLGPATAGPEVFEARALAHEGRGDLAAAEAEYRKAEPASGLGKLGLARVLRRLGRPAEAEPLLQALLAATPGAVGAYKESARVKLALQRPDEAVGDAATAAALLEGDAEAKALVTQVAVAKALMQMARGEAAVAVEELKVLRDREPADPEARVGLARALIATRQADAALVELDAALQAAPNHAEALHQKGLVLHTMKGDAAGAAAALALAVAADPAQPDYRAALGAALLDQKQFERAVAELQKAVESPALKRVDAWVMLGGAHLASKRYPQAVAALEKGIALLPKSGQAQAYLAWAHFGLKDATAFKRHANEAKTLGVKDPTLLDYLKRIEAGEPIK